MILVVALFLMFVALHWLRAILPKDVTKIKWKARGPSGPHLGTIPFRRMIMICIEARRPGANHSYAEAVGDSWSVRQPSNTDRESIDRDELDLSQLLDGYESVTMFLEDLVVVVPERGSVVFFDVVTGKDFRTKWTDEQIFTMLSVALFGDDDPSDPATEAAYAELEPLLVNCPRECRPIP